MSETEIERLALVLINGVAICGVIIIGLPIYLSARRARQHEKEKEQP